MGQDPHSTHQSTEPPCVSTASNSSTSACRSSSRGGRLTARTRTSNRSCARVESGGTHVWGETSCLAAPCYSPEWAAGVFAVARDWLAPALVGTDVSQRRGPAPPPRPLQRQPVRQGALRQRLVDACTRSSRDSRLHRAARRDAQRRPRRRRLRRRGLDRRPACRRSRKAVDSRFPADQAKVPARLGHPDARAVPPASFPRTRSTSTATAATRSRSGCSASSTNSTGDDRAAAGARRPGRSRQAASGDRARRSAWTRASRRPTEPAQAIELGSCRYVNIKPGRVGGLTNALAIHDLCRDAGHSLLGRRHAGKRRRRAATAWRWQCSTTSLTRPTSSLEPVLPRRPRPTAAGTDSLRRRHAPGRRRRHSRRCCRTTPPASGEMATVARHDRYRALTSDSASASSRRASVRSCHGKFHHAGVAQSVGGNGSRLAWSIQSRAWRTQRRDCSNSPRWKYAIPSKHMSRGCGACKRFDCRKHEDCIGIPARSDRRHALQSDSAG